MSARRREARSIEPEGNPETSESNKSGAKVIGASHLLLARLQATHTGCQDAKFESQKAVNEGDMKTVAAITLPSWLTAGRV